MELSIAEYLIVCAMRGNGRTAYELIENLGENERQEVVKFLQHLPLTIKVIYQKLGISNFDIYDAEEQYFETVEEIKRLITGE